MDSDFLKKKQVSRFVNTCWRYLLSELILSDPHSLGFVLSKEPTYMPKSPAILDREPLIHSPTNDHFGMTVHSFQPTWLRHTLWDRKEHPIRFETVESLLLCGTRTQPKSALHKRI